MKPSWRECRCPLAVRASGECAIHPLLLSVAIYCLLMYIIILKCMDLLLRIVLRVLFSGYLIKLEFNVTLGSSLQPAHSVDGQFTLNLRLSLVLDFLDPHLRKWGGNLWPEELQEVQLGLRPARKSAMPCAALLARLSPCPCPTTSGQSLKTWHGGQWRAGLDSCSPPSTPEPGGGPQEQHKLGFSIHSEASCF